MIQSKQELEDWYKTPDPWAYKTTSADSDRKFRILDSLRQFGYYQKALDIGCGEGYITASLPANVIHGIELSDNAASRFPYSVTRVSEPDGKYDLVCTMGTLYKQYDSKQMIAWIEQAASKHILIAGIKDWLIQHSFGKIVHQEQFPYRQYNQLVTIYEVSP